MDDDNTNDISDKENDSPDTNRRKVFNRSETKELIGQMKKLQSEKDSLNQAMEQKITEQNSNDIHEISTNASETHITDTI